MVLTALLLSTISFLSGCGTPDSGYEFLNHSDTVDYVGIAVCASCHPDNHETFIHTGMGQSFGHANRSKSKAVFGKSHVVTDSSSGLSYHPYWKGEELFILEFKIEGEDTIHKLEQRIDYIVGSGQHTNSHLFRNGNYIYQAPLTFYTQEGIWDLPPGFENGNNSRFSRIINDECMSCHNSMPVLVENSSFQFQSIGQGIDCERCHGPGELHVNLRRKGEGADVSKGVDLSIVNPAKLSLDRQIDICQRCHLQGLNILQEGKGFTDFRPGMTLSDVFEVYLPLYEGQTVIDMANHAQRFQQSECFKANKKDFSCISCHNPHVSVKQTSSEGYNATCISCHTALDEESHHTGNPDCVSCHMPLVETGDIGHVKIHDHKIAKPGKLKSQGNILKLIGLYAVNNPDPSDYNLCKAHLEYWEKFDKNPFYLEQAEEYLEKNDFKDLKLKLAYLKGEYQTVIELHGDLERVDAWLAYMIGQSFYNLEKFAEAELYFKLSFVEDPDQADIGIKLAKLYLKHQKVEAFSQLIIDLKQRFGLNAGVYNVEAEFLLKTGNYTDAKGQLDKALRYDPLSLEVWENQLNLAIATADVLAKEYWAKKILNNYPEHPDRETLESLLKSEH